MQPEVKARLERYHELLLQWQSKINLVSPNTIDDAWSRHFEDSVQIAQYIQNTVKTVADIGSGAGFPGLVLAIMLPDIQFDMIESDSRKCAFLRNVSRETNINNVDIHTARIEKKLPDLAVNCVTARALADLEKLFQYTSRQWVNNKDFTLFAPKGRHYLNEIYEAEKAYTFDYKVEASMVDTESVILIVSNIKQKHK